VWPARERLHSQPKERDSGVDYHLHSCSPRHRDGRRSLAAILETRAEGCSQFPDGDKMKSFPKKRSFCVTKAETLLAQFLCEEAEPWIPIVIGHETVDGRRETSIIPARNSDSIGCQAAFRVKSIGCIRSKPVFFDEVSVRFVRPSACFVIVCSCSGGTLKPLRV